MRRVGLLFLAVLCGFGLIGVGAARLQLDATVYDFGKVVYGYSYSHAFRVTNVGTSPLTISNLSPFCSCTTATISQESILPGQSAELRVTLDTAKLSRNAGSQTKLILAKTNDPASSSVYLEILANIVLDPQPYHLSTNALHAAFYVLFDLRESDAYAAGHLFGAISIPYSDLGSWSARLPRATRLVACDADGETALQAAFTLDRAGFQAEALAGGLLAWQRQYGGRYLTGAVAGTPAVATGTSDLQVSAQTLNSQFYVLIDLRSEEQFQAGHLMGALHVPDDSLMAWIAASSLPSDATIILYGDDSHASDRAAQQLRSHGYAAAFSLLGGLKDWIAEHEDLKHPERSRILEGAV